MLHLKNCSKMLILLKNKSNTKINLNRYERTSEWCVS